MSIKKSLMITALTAIMLGGAAQAIAKTVILNAPQYQGKSFSVYVNGKQKGYCSQYGAKNGWQNTKANANRGDSVEVIFWRKGCFSKQLMATTYRRVGNDNLKYFWFRMK